MEYTPAITKTGDDQENLNRTNFMNTNTIRVLITTVATALIAGLGGLEVTGNMLTGAAVGLSYLVVVALIAIAASDYRSGPKAYFAAPLVTGHFQQKVPASIAQRTPSAKTRVAA
jgi:hypothetical protein